MIRIEKWVIGAALAVAIPVLIPVIKESIYPLAVAGVKKAKSSVQLIKEEIEDIIVEAQFERMQQQFDQELIITDERGE
ncbi:DUF5132 domain-containing protein [Paenibacillus albiflavus]|uniref:DUF5132 domain-containing protein n=1 Tax=Paenibacillus albiflavus TaxID=2545760 RepID=A0A4R4E918_9BACL|nr:DUF5132 domain-containing protein [Paenibacillus albiflavus]TCZ75483.1 DUF5132 domain-containing protein [Paenibacillus albiflavus]